MEEVARRNDAPLFPERGFTISPAVDANLRDRIRSLLVSRNRRNPSKTPCPSPDHNLTPRDLAENQSDSAVGYLNLYTINPIRAIEELAWVEGTNSDMGATRFDGPAGQIDDDSRDTPARRPSQPGIPNGRETSGDWPWSTPVSGLNQRAHMDILGREASIADSVNRAKSSSSKKSTGSRIPRFHLRTVPPATDVNKILRPNPLHIPGSFRSEVDIQKDHGSKKLSHPRDSMVEAMGEEILAVPYHEGLDAAHSHKAAVDVLREVSMHDHIQVDQQTPSLHNALSHGSLKSMKSMNTPTQPNQVLRKPSIDHAASGEVAQPPLTPSNDHGHIQGDKSDPPIFVIEDGSDEEVENRDILIPQHEASLDHDIGEREQFLNGQRISDLLAQLPPIKQATVDAVRFPTTAVPIKSEQATSNERSSPVSSLHSLLLNEVEGSSSPVSPLIPKPLEPPFTHGTDRDEDTTPLVGDTRRSSQVTAKVSPIGRAMSMLSDLSGRSRGRTPSLQTSVDQKSTDSTSNLTTRPLYRSKRDAQDIKCLRAITMPVRQGYKPLTNDKQEQRLAASTSIEGTSLLRQQDKQGEGFTKVITDLELLLKEALNIAGQAASNEQSQGGPLASQAQPNGYTRAASDGSTDSSECPSALSGGADEEDNLTTIPHHTPSHRREHVVIKEPEHDAMYHGHFKKARDATPYPARTRHQSTVPGENDEPGSKDRVPQRHFLEAPRTSSKVFKPAQEPLHHQASIPVDWAAITVPSRSSKLRLEIKPPPPAPQHPPTVRATAKEQHAFIVRDHGGSEDTLTRDRIRDYVNTHQRPPIQPRQSSIRLRRKANPGLTSKPELLNVSQDKESDDEASECECVPYVADFRTSGLRYHPVFHDAVTDGPSQPSRQGPSPFYPRNDTLTSLRNSESEVNASGHEEAPPVTNTYSLEGRHHFSIREPRGFSLSRSHRRSPIARDWSNSRKRYTATVACITTAFMGLIVGIYAGEVPAIQYVIADEHHYTILGNVFFFIGLAITTALFYPLPLLHGRKPYTLAALAILLPLQFPQALAINSNRSPYVATYRVGLLTPRMFAGIVMGFANINFKTTLLDLYGASLQSGNPHQETVNENDVRRHGGGMGVWLSIWTWCAIGSIGIGFLIGAGIISGLDVSWGFWILIILNAAVLVLNILTPEVRRSAYRRSMAEVRSGGDVSRRVARGEIKMHLQSTGPIWWWEEVWWGHVLAIRMLKQPGFAILALYLGWIYGQVVLVIVVSGLCRIYNSIGLPFFSYSGRFCPNTIAFILNTLD